MICIISLCLNVFIKCLCPFYHFYGVRGYRTITTDARIRHNNRLYSSYYTKDSTLRLSHKNIAIDLVTFVSLGRITVRFHE